MNRKLYTFSVDLVTFMNLSNSLYLGLLSCGEIYSRLEISNVNIENFQLF